MTRPPGTPPPAPSATGHLTPEQIRARVDEITPRTNPDGSINAEYVALEQPLRERHGHPSYIAELDGPGKFRPVQDPPLAPWEEALVADPFDPADPRLSVSAFVGTHLRAVERVGRKLDRVEVEAAAVNAIAVASVAYRENRLALSRVLRWSLGYGIELPELASTSGLPETLVLELLDEVD